MIGRVPGIQFFERCQSMICHARKSPRHAEIFQCLSDRIGRTHCGERNLVSRTDAAKNLSLSSNNISDSDADHGLRTTNRHRCEGSTGAQITEGHRPYALTQTKNFAGGAANDHARHCPRERQNRRRHRSVGNRASQWSHCGPQVRPCGNLRLAHVFNG
jgi:hypothetical protein